MPTLRQRTLRQKISDCFPLYRDLKAYLRYRRNMYLELNRFKGGAKGIESIHFNDAPWPDPRPIEILDNPDCETFELVFMAMICRIANPRRIFETGTFEGRSANVMALHTPDDCRIETLDLPVKNEKIETGLKILENDEKWLMKSDERLGGRLGTLNDPTVNAKITQHRGDSAKFDYSPFHGEMDMVFVDRAHSCDYVLSDANNGLKMLGDRGFILFHDYVTEDDVVLACA